MAGSYGDFLHRSVLKQGEVLGDMAWEGWAVTRKALELGGVNPDQLTTPAARVAAANRIDWTKVTMSKLKAKLGFPSICQTAGNGSSASPS